MFRKFPLFNKNNFSYHPKKFVGPNIVLRERPARSSDSVLSKSKAALPTPVQCDYVADSESHVGLRNLMHGGGADDTIYMRTIRSTGPRQCHWYINNFGRKIPGRRVHIYPRRSRSVCCTRVHDRAWRCPYLDDVRTVVRLDSDR
jgi:hypothetical protein